MLKQLVCAMVIATPAWAAGSDLPKLSGNYTFSRNRICWGKGAPANSFVQSVGRAAFDSRFKRIAWEEEAEIIVNPDGTGRSQGSKGPGASYEIIDAHTSRWNYLLTDYVQFGSLDKNRIASSAYGLDLSQNDEAGCSTQTVYTRAP